MLKVFVGLRVHAALGYAFIQNVANSELNLCLEFAIKQYIAQIKCLGRGAEKILLGWWGAEPLG